MEDDDYTPEAFAQQLARQIQHYELATERLERTQGVVAVSVIKVHRLLQAATAELEYVKNQIAGITPHGNEVDA